MWELFIFPTNTCFWLACYIEDLESYKKIYKVKGRKFSNPLAVLVLDFEYLEKNTKLNLEQISFLKNYKNPFTILLDIKNILDEKLLKQIKKLNNSEIYEKIAFRVSHNFMHKKLIKKNWLMFLTSANKSWESEIFSSIKVKEKFKEEIEKFWIKVFAHNDFCINSKQKSSNIFEFVWEKLELKYFRKTKKI